MYMLLFIGVLLLCFCQPSIDCCIINLLFVLRCLEDRVKSQKSLQGEEGAGTMEMDREAKPEGNATMLQRLITVILMSVISSENDL